jgi:D-lactate dehydrogenase
MKTLVYSMHAFEEGYFANLPKNHELSFTEIALTAETVHLAKGFEAIALFSNDTANKEVISTLSSMGVRFIALRSTGYDNVDLPEAQQKGMRVANVPEYSPYAIAEHSVALLLALNRKLIAANYLVQIQDFRLDPLIGFDLRDKTIGVVGTGKIGMAFARIMKGFGTRLIAYDIKESEEAKALGMTYCSLDELCRKSDVISLHCPLNEHTRYLFDEAQFSQMKKGVYFINTGRGGLVNTKSLINALLNGTVGAAGLDVYENEKGLFFNDYRNKVIKDELYARLHAMPNVLITGHQAFLTREALSAIAGTTLKNLDQWSQTGKCDNDLFE